MDYFLLTVLGFTSFLLMGIVLLQRGRGGGLAGAFGGLGGQSAFGTKAGDVFTKITIGITVFWVFLAGGSGYALRYYEENGNFRGGKDATPEKSSMQSTDDENVKKKTIDDAFPIDKPTTKSKKTDKAEVDDTKKPADKSQTDKPDADKPDADKPKTDEPKTDKPTKTDSKTEKPSPNDPAKDDAKSKPPVKKGDDGKKPADKTEKKDTKPAKTDNDKADKTD